LRGKYTEKRKKAAIAGGRLSLRFVETRNSILGTIGKMNRQVRTKGRELENKKASTNFQFCARRGCEGGGGGKSTLLE